MNTNKLKQNSVNKANKCKKNSKNKNNTAI